MAKLGPRLLFLNVELPAETEEEQVQKLRDGKGYLDKVEACRLAVSNYLKYLWRIHGEFGGLVWDRAADDPSLLRKIVRLTNLGVKMRAQLARSKSNDLKIFLDGANQYEYSPALVEGPDRYRNLLYNLARGHATVQGRTALSEEDVKVIAKVTLSSGPKVRTLLFNAVLQDPAPISTSQAAAAMECSEPTARNVARDMAQLGIIKAEGTSAIKIGLAQEIEWLRKILAGV